MNSLSSKVGHGFRWVVQPLLVILVLVIGFVGATQLSSKDGARPDFAQRKYAPLVRVQTAQPQSTTVRIEASGALEARTQVQLVAQVSGRVVEIHPSFRAGGRFQAGEVLVGIEATDYELAVASSRSDVSTAQSALQTLQAEADSAREEWRLLNGDNPPPTLVVKKPQLDAARARIQAAKAQLAGAELNLKRTRIALPWAGRVVQTNVDVGGVVSQGQALGGAYSTEVFEISVPLRQDQLRWIHLPGEQLSADALHAGPAPITIDLHWKGATTEALETQGAVPLENMLRAVEGLRRIVSRSSAGLATVTLEPTGEFDSEYLLDRVDEALRAMESFPPTGAELGQPYLGYPASSAQVRVQVAGREVSLPGRAVRIESQLDAASRFARLVVEVDTSTLAADVAPRLLPGSFADVTLEGDVVRDVAAIPRSSIRDNNQVWVVSEQTLTFQDVESVHMEGENVWVRGLEPDTFVVVSDLEVVTNGMQVRVQDDAPPTPSQETGSPSSGKGRTGKQAAEERGAAQQ